MKPTLAQKSPLSLSTSALDRNGDGIITKEEAHEGMEEFEKDLDRLFDAQADGTIHLEEEVASNRKLFKSSKICWKEVLQQESARPPDYIGFEKTLAKIVTEDLGYQPRMIRSLEESSDRSNKAVLQRA